GRADQDDFIVPAESTVLVLVKRDDTLLALRSGDGELLWKREGVQNFVTYRGIVYVLGDDLRALMPDKGLTLWKKRLEEGGGRDLPMTAGGDCIILSLGDQLLAFNWETGAEVYPLDAKFKDSLEVHGPVLLAVNSRTRETHAFEANSGVSLWVTELGAYDVFDGQIYALSCDQDRERVQLRLARGSVTTGRLRVTDSYDLPPDKNRIRTLPAPVVTADHIVAVCGRWLLLIERESGKLIAKHEMDTDVNRPLVISPNCVYVIDAKRNLVAYDLRDNLNPSWRRPTSGRAAVALGPATLYFLDKGELSALGGTDDRYDEKHLKAMAAPTIEKPGDVAEAAREATVQPYRFEGAEAVFDRKGLVKQMSLDTSRVTELSFYELLYVGELRDWQEMIDESLSRMAPGERKTRMLSQEELRTLFAEVIQRHESGSTPLLRKMLNSRNRATVSMVLELMRTGSRSVYGPMLVRVFGDALKENDFITAGHCAQAVGSWRYEPGVSLLVKGLTDASVQPALRTDCANALANFEGPEVISALRKVAREEIGGRNSLPPLCMGLLVGLGDKGIDAVTDVLKDSSAPEENRVKAADALARAKGREAVPALLAVLKSRGPRASDALRAAAASSLGPLAKDNEEAFNALVDLMKDDKTDPYLRNACMNGLGLSGSIKAVPWLIRYLQDPGVDNHKFTRASAYQYLVQISGEKRIGVYKAKWQQWWDENKERLLKQAGE
ncbi:MAG TPA: HEAT repeat domain-containing protein, partial [Planctomycetota bacterium]|nr:HEAT repeat domain-containing protein [Planctomycetota bacterium]